MNQIFMKGLFIHFHLYTTKEYHQTKLQQFYYYTSIQQNIHASIFMYSANIYIYFYKYTYTYTQQIKYLLFVIPKQNYRKKQMQMRKIEQEQNSYYSNDKLNTAFIADDSKQIRDQIMSSISSISRRASNSMPGSPFLYCQPEISSMDEWSNHTPPNIFGKNQTNFDKFRKRTTRSSIPQPILQMPQDQKWVQKISKCSKRRIGQKNKQITVQTIQTPVTPYQLRSKAKITIVNQSPNNQNDSSSDQIRQMVAEIDGGKKKNPNTKSGRKMLAQ